MKDGDVLKVRGSARPLDDFRPREGVEDRSRGAYLMGERSWEILKEVSRGHPGVRVHTFGYWEDGMVFALLGGACMVEVKAYSRSGRRTYDKQGTTMFVLAVYVHGCRVDDDGERCTIVSTTHLGEDTWLVYPDAWGDPDDGDGSGCFRRTTDELFVRAEGGEPMPPAPVPFEEGMI